MHGWTNDEEAAIYLEVEGETFKLPRGPFVNCSPYFRAVLASSRHGRGLSLLNPITLDDVKLSHFKRLLRVMFPCTPAILARLTLREWISVLELATQWTFPGVCKTTIRHLDALLAGGKETDAAWRVTLSLKYNITCWFVPAAVRIIQNESFLDRTIIRIMGAECATRIAVVWVQYVGFMERHDLSPSRDATPLATRAYFHFPNVERSSGRAAEKSTTPFAFSQYVNTSIPASSASRTSSQAFEGPVFDFEHAIAVAFATPLCP